MSIDAMKQALEALEKANEQQAERIKELEAKWLDEQKAALTAEAELELANQQIANQQMLSGVDADALAHARSELTALRQRIADAPVVAWLHTQSNGCSSLIRTPPSAFDPQDLADAEVSIYALISKEDLK